MTWTLHCWTHEGPLTDKLDQSFVSLTVHTWFTLRPEGAGGKAEPSHGHHHHPATADSSLLNLLALCERHGRAWRAAASSVGGISRH
jgi:hypothetical protein